ncbi:MAG: hypothetical protein KBD22_00855 [Candidatus Pacebacteria bacterium]|jgi:hypothetical protein|nr:hypothetical protein [Candidatus Paceibacterota bacterium]MBP9770015.1 hypothetical protein [Candidatus Paceibacterota bacterium]
METLKFNNQPKAEVEKTPQENEGLLNEQEQESGKRENIVLEIDGQKIEAVKYYFEYPERIQKETGILGYERVKITKEIMPAQEDSIISLLLIMSDGEYPRYSFNHKIGGFATIEQIDKYNNFFKDNKFFLNKIYDLKAFSIDSLSNPAEGRRLEFQPNFSIFNQSTNKKIFPQNFIPTSDVLSYKDIMINGDAYATTLYSMGLNCTPGGFFYGADTSMISIGFSFKDPLLKEYFEEVFCAWIKLDAPQEKLEEVVANLLIMRSFQETNISQEEYFNSLFKSHNINKIIDPKFLYNASLVADYKKNGFDWGKGISPATNASVVTVENYLPIFIGHKKIPQLSWGHAKYAHYFNDKSFNFFKFKHADHLPVKEEVASSDS